MNARSATQRLLQIAVTLGAIGLVACVLGEVIAPQQFFISWLVALLFWLGIALGSLAWAMIHHLTGGRWGYSVRRFFEAAMSTLPLIAALFIPVFLGTARLFPWARAADRAGDEVLQHRASYMNEPAFIIRAVLLFAIWITIAHLLRKWSAEQDKTGNVEATKKLRGLSGPGLVIYPLTVTFGSVDWIMSTERHWFSTMFPILICIGQMLAALAFSILLLAWLEPRTAIAQASGPKAFHDLGNLLLALTMMWAYLAFGQLLIIWSGDLPHEISWYLHRIAGNWKIVAWFLFLFHFLLPFFALLSRRNKSRLFILTAIAATVFLAHTVEVWWLVAPSFFNAGMHLHWMDLAAFAGIGGLWFAFFIDRLQRQPLVPLNDPRFAVAVRV
jgi:uncharacterized membrane protein YciS (DUF1049 family)